MNKNKSFISSFKNALSGLFVVWIDERNMKIESAIGCAALILCFFLKVTKWEWLAVLFCCMIVTALECMNSAVENAVDFAGEEIDPRAKKAKDFAAGAVLIASVCSAIIGAIIFLPYILAYL